MNGVIASGSKFPGSSNLSLESLEKQIERAFAGKKIAGVALIINSPGGSPVQSALISERIVELSSKNNIPVFAFVEDVAASGGYWLACSADEIFVMPASIVGSIGVISAGFGFVDVIKKIGVERRVFSKGENKGMLDPFQPQNPDDVKVITDLQEEIHNQFKDWVSKRRGNRLNKETINKGLKRGYEVIIKSEDFDNGINTKIEEIRKTIKVDGFRPLNGLKLIVPGK